MMTKEEYLKRFERFLISQVAILIRDNKCLILRTTYRENNKWVLPGGRIDKGEHDKDRAFVRELEEEIGFTNVKILGLVDYDVWLHDVPRLEIKEMPVCGIVRLIEDTGQEIKMSEEHSDMVWVTEGDVDKYEFVWPNAPRLIKKGFEYYRFLNK